MVKKAKAAEVEGRDKESQGETVTDESTEQTQTETGTPEDTVGKPEAEVGESKVENWKQKFQTLEGIHKQVITELNIIKKDRQDFASLSQEVKQQGQTLEVLVDTISATELGGNEELKEKLQKTREEAAARIKVQQVADAKRDATLERIGKIATAAGLKQDDEALKPAKETFLAGKYDEAYDLTVIAALGQKKTEPLKSDEKPAKPKDNLKVITSSPAPGKSTADMTTGEKIRVGIQERKEKLD